MAAIVGLIPSSLFTTAHSNYAKNILSITPEHLKKYGFNAQPWVDYLTDSFLPSYLKMSNLLFYLASDPVEKKIMTLDRSKFEAFFTELIHEIKSLPFNKTHWKSKFEVIERAADSCAAIYIKIKIDQSNLARMIPGEQLSSFNQEVSIFGHLLHLLLDRMSWKFAPNHEHFFAFKTRNRCWAGVKEKGIWDAIRLINPEDKTLTFCSWTSDKNPILNNAVLIEGDVLTQGTPFIAMEFQLNCGEPAIHEALKTSIPFKFIQGQTTLKTITAYCNEKPVNEQGNTYIFLENSGFGIPQSEHGLHQLGDPNAPLHQQMQTFTQIATEVMKNNWIEYIGSHGLDNKAIFTYVYLLPKTEVEAAEKLIETLELALEDPEENASYIEYIASANNLSFSTEEIKEAYALEQVDLPAIALPIVDKEESAASLAAMPPPVARQGAEGFDLPPAVAARAIIQKVKKRIPAAQKAKPRPVFASISAASSSTRSTMTKEEVKDQLSASSMPPKFKDKAIDLLSGERLANKREEGKFFLKLSKYQAEASGSEVNYKKKGGSHSTVRVLRTEDGKEITGNATTLVNKHGKDPSRGSSTATQQKNLIRFLTTLG